MNPLPLDVLEPHRFEDLVRQLLYDFRRWRRLEATGRSGADDGFDARGWEVVTRSAACEFSKRTRDSFRAACAARGIEEWHLWGKAEIEDRLFQPANDPLLFAYFGFSLRIRKRSLKTQLTSRLATKRRLLKILENYEPILIRDATDDRYPYLADGKPEDRRRRGR